MTWKRVPAYIGAQTAGAFAAVISAHTMFNKPVLFASQRARESGASTASALFGWLAPGGPARPKQQEAANAG